MLRIMESLVERPQVQLMRAVKKTLRMERRAETRSWFVAVLAVSFYLFFSFRHWAWVDLRLRRRRGVCIRRRGDGR